MAVESKFREDKDLAFLQHADWQDLKILAEALIKDHSGTEQWTGQLKKTLTQNISMYKTSEAEAYQNSWKAIAAELQLFGGDTIANLTRRKGVLYEELLHDVAKKVKIDFHKGTTSVANLEEKILRSLFGRITTLNDINVIYETLEKEGLLGLTSFKSDSWNTIKKGIGNRSKVSTAALLLSRANPVTAIATVPLALKGVSDPAYRVTIPAVCIVAMMRTKYTNNSASFDEF